MEGSQCESNRWGLRMIKANERRSESSLDDPFDLVAPWTAVMINT